MIITNVRATNVCVPFDTFGRWEPVTMWYSTRYASRHAIVTIETDEGITGIGETEQENAREVEALRPSLVGKDPFDVEMIVRSMYGGESRQLNTIGHIWHALPTAGGVEMALLDIMGKSCNKPVYKLLGGRFRDHVDVRYWMCCKSPKEQASEAVEAVKRGWKSFKVKIGTNPEVDVERVKAIREAVGDGIELGFDINGGYTVGTAIRTLRKMERYDPSHIEEPVSGADVQGMKEVKRHVDIPIVSCGSAIGNKELIFDLVKNHACDEVHVDQNIQGGIMEVKKIAAICEAAGIPVSTHCGCTELGVFEAAKLALIQTTPNFLSCNDDGNHHIEKAGDIIKDPFRTVNGTLKVPEGPGLGVELDAAKMKKYEKLYLSGKYKHELGLGRMPVQYWYKR